MRRDRVAIVDAYSTGRHLAGRFKEKGYSCVHVQSREDILPFDQLSFRRDDFIDNVVFRDDFGAVLQSLRRHDVSAVVAGCESGIGLTDALAGHLGLAGNDAGFSRAKRDKHLMVEALRQAGLDAPHTLLVRSAAELEGAAAVLGFPVILKPLDSAGTDGVFLCRTQEDLDRAFAGQIGRTNAMGSVNDGLIVQELLLGEQYIVNTISAGGRHFVSEIWHDEREQIGTGIAYCRETLLPAEGTLQKHLSDYTVAVLKALGIVQGPTHAEIMLTPRGPVLIEIGARLHGSIDPTALDKALGRSHVCLTVDSYVDPGALPARLAPVNRRASVACVSLISHRTGRILQRKNLDRLHALASFHSILHMLGEGEQLKVTVDLATNPGILYLVHESAEQIARDYRAIRAIEAEDGFFILADH